MRIPVLIAAGVAAAFALATGVAANSPARIGAVSVTVPDGWQSEIAEGMLLMAPPGGAGLILVLPSLPPPADPNAGVEMLAGALTAGETITQQSVPQDLPGLAYPGALGAVGSRMADGSMVYRLVAVLSAPGGAAGLVLAAADEASLSALTDAYLGVIASAEIGAPAVTPPPAETVPPVAIAPPAGRASSAASIPPARSTR